MSALTDRIAEDFASSAQALQAGGQAAAVGRRRALDALAAKGLPSSRDENWKYANLRSLERARFVPAAPVETLPAAAELPAALPGIARYVFVDAHFAPAASAPLRAGVVSRTVQAGDGAAMADERFALLNQAFATDGLLIEVDETHPRPLQLEVLFLTSAAAQSGGSYPRLGVRLHPRAQLTL